MSRLLPYVVASAGLGTVLGGLIFLSPLALSRQPSEPLRAPSPSTYDPSHSLAPLVQAVEPAVVAIEVEGSASAMGMHPLLGPLSRHGEGSGFIVSPDGLVLTNHHVIDGADTIQATLTDGTTVAATVVGSDPRLDVALLQLPQDRSWPHVELGSSAELQVGDWVLAAGNPLGLGRTFTVGIVSGKGRMLGHDWFDDFIQTDAAINQGNSGGPLFDLDGRVVGMNTAIIQGANTVAFAIPSDLIRDTLDDLSSLGHVSRGYLGVLHGPLSGEVANHCGVTDLERGALVRGVIEDTPAAEAGLEPCDVIVGVGDDAVEDAGDLVRAVGLRDPGDEVEIRYLRDGRERELTVSLAERPEGRADLGLSVIPIGDGVEVQAIRPDSPLARILEPGDVIQQAGDQRVRDADDLTGAVQDGARVLTVRRGKAVRLIEVPR